MSKKGEYYGGSLEEKIVHNLVELQKVHTDLAEKFTKLSNQISQLLTLFEMSAREFSKQINMPAIEKDKEFLDKIDKLLEQNKTIAKGLTMMEEKMREKIYGGPSRSMPSAMSNTSNVSQPSPFPMRPQSSEARAPPRF